ncbi:MAG: cytochrome P450 [Deltaproteobacteria bacterium]|nr:cytochrome P450 [Deltaproteobacteria bacterium]
MPRLDPPSPSMPPSESLPVVDLAEPALWQDPAAALAPIREQAPLARTARGERVVLRYAETESLLADARMRTIGARLLEGVGISEGPLADWWRLVMFNTNPPEHGRLRNLVSRAFTPRRVEALRPRVRSLAEALVEPLLGAGEIDYEAALADPLPIRVTCELLGIPESEQPGVARWTSELGRVFATRLSDEQRARCEDAVEQLSDLLGELFARRRRDPRDDLLTALARADEEGDRLSTDECRAMAINLLFAGHDTTRGLLAIGLAALIRAPDAMAALRAEPELVPGAVEEMLRLEPPTLGSLRAPIETIETPGGELPAGVPVHFLFPGGNRDPRVFDEPDRFDPRRRGPRPLSFGLGAHFCLGAGLARMEARETLTTLLAHTSRIELRAPPTLVPFATIRRLESGLRLELVAS